MKCFFDYPNQVIKMYDASNAASFRKEGQYVTVPFYGEGHLPIIAVKVGHKKVFLGLDSGAENQPIGCQLFQTSQQKSFERKKQGKGYRP